MILSIDPGSEKSAWCHFDGERPLQWGTHPNSEMLHALRTDWHPVDDLLAVEMIASYGMAVGKEVFDTCLWIGRFIEAWDKRGGEAQLIYRKQVKLFLCESNRANDSMIRQAIIDRFGPGKDKAIGRKAEPGPLYGIKGDEWSALAVALTAAAQ